MAHVMSVETGDYLQAFSLVARLANASSERFSAQVTVYAGGVWAVEVTALDVTPNLIKALLREVRRWLVDHELKSVVMHADGRSHTMSAGPKEAVRERGRPEPVTPRAAEERRS